MANSHHDMRAKLRIPGPISQACIYCHHPHTSAGVALELLWNINSPSISFITYGQTATTDAVDIGDELGTTGSSLFSLYCMSCHDGVTATDSLTSTPEQRIRLAEDHPVDFSYTEAAVTDDGLMDPRNKDTVIGRYSGTNYPLYDGTLQCTTCHDVHDGNDSESLNGIQFLRGEINIVRGSIICRDCHIDK